MDNRRSKYAFQKIGRAHNNLEVLGGNIRPQPSLYPIFQIVLKADSVRLYVILL